MHNYPTDSMARRSAVFAYAWASARLTEYLPDSLLHGQIDASRQVSIAFQPEQLSGFCASG